MSKPPFFPGQILKPGLPIVATATAEKFAGEIYATDEPIVTFFHDGSHEPGTTSGGAGIRYRDCLPGGGGCLTKLAYHLCPVYSSLDAEMQAYMLAVQRSIDLTVHHKSFLKDSGKVFVIRHFFDSQTMLGWLVGNDSVKEISPLRDLLQRLTRNAVALTNDLFQLAKKIGIYLYDVVSPLVPEDCGQDYPSARSRTKSQTDSPITPTLPASVTTSR